MKKALVLLLALMLVFSCFAGCEKIPEPKAEEDGNCLFHCGLLPVYTQKEAGKRTFGYVNTEGKLVIPLRYDGAKHFSPIGLAAVKVGEKWGFINTKGKMVIQPRFAYKSGDAPPDFTDAGFARVMIDEKWGCINTKGELVIDAIYERVGDYAENSLTPVKLDGLWGYVDPKGKMVIQPQFDWAYSFAEGMARIKKDGKYGYINEKGEMIVPPQFTEASAFIGNTAAVALHNDGWGIIDKTGRYLVEPVWNYIYMQDDGLYRLSGDEEYGRFSTDGSLAGEPRTDIVGDLVQNGLTRIKTDGKYGYIDSAGKTVIAPQFDWAGDFSENGMAAVRTGEERFYIDETGKAVLKISAEQLGAFAENGLALIKKDGKYGYINEKGEIAIAPQFEYAEGFMGQVARFKEGERWGLVHENGRIVAPAIYKHINDEIRGGTITFYPESYSYYGFFGEDGQVIAPAQYLDTTLYTIVPPVCMPFYDDGYGVVSKSYSGKDNSRLVIDREGNYLFDESSDLHAVSPWFWHTAW